MPDDRHPADQAVTVPKKQRKSICILDEAVVGKISDGQQQVTDLFNRFAEAESLAGAVVEFGGDCVQIGL